MATKVLVLKLVIYFNTSNTLNVYSGLYPGDIKRQFYIPEQIVQDYKYFTFFKSLNVSIHL